MNNNKIKLLFIAFLAMFVCLTVILTMQGLGISDLKNNNKDLSNQLEESNKELEENKEEIEELKIAISNAENASSNTKTGYTINYDEDYINFIEKELIPKIDKEELIEICKRSSTYSIYICELDIAYREHKGEKYLDKTDEIGERIYINGSEDIYEFDLEYKNFWVGVTKTTNKSGFILMYSGAREGMRIEEPWIEVLNYNDYETTYSAGGLAGDGIMHIFSDVEKGSIIEIKIGEELAKLLELDNDIIKINIK